MATIVDFTEALAAPQSHAFLGALIGGAVSLIGGIAGRKDAKKRDAAAAEAAKVPVVTSHKVDAKRLVQEAQAAGFNPVTFLNAGALSAYTTTTTTGQNAMAAVSTAPSMGSVLAGAAGTAFNIAREDGLFNSRGSLASSSFRPNTTLGALLGATPAGGRAGGGGLAFAARPTMSVKMPSDGSAIRPSVEIPTMTNPHTSAAVDPTVTDAEMMETRYGESELLALAAGVYRTYADTVYNLTGSTAAGRNRVYRSAWEAVKSSPAVMSSGLNRAQAIINKNTKGKALPVGNWLD